eukprot:3209638-Pleurochrysis_carterae.AAC.2
MQFLRRLRPPKAARLLSGAVSSETDARPRGHRQSHQSRQRQRRVGEEKLEQMLDIKVVVVVVVCVEAWDEGSTVVWTCVRAACAACGSGEKKTMESPSQSERDGPAESAAAHALPSALASSVTEWPRMP